MILSRSCTYAIRAILYLAAKPAGTFLFVKEIAREEGIPFYFLGKIFQHLAKDGLLLSVKGRRGGFALARSPSEITLLEIVEIVDGLDGFDRCVIGLSQCSDEHPCPLHERWAEIRSDIHDMFTTKSIAQLLQQHQTPT